MGHARYRAPLPLEWGLRFAVQTSRWPMDDMRDGIAGGADANRVLGAGGTHSRVGLVALRIGPERSGEAHRALQRYPTEHATIVDRCTRQMQSFGWSLVKACADQDIEAERALRSMGRE